MSQMFVRRTRRLLLLGVLALCLSAVVPAASAEPVLRSGTYAVTVRTSGVAFQSTWTLRVTGSSITGTSTWTCCPGGRTDPLSGSVQGATATIVRDCNGQGINVACRQTYVVRAGASGTLSGTGSGYGAKPGTTIAMKLKSAPSTPPAAPKLPPLPPTANATARIFQHNANHGKGPGRATVKRDGKLYSGLLNSKLQNGDIIKTDGNTVVAVEFIIGGRVGININTEVEMINERAVAIRGESTTRAALKNAGLWVKADKLREPLEIQTNGGVTSIKG
ncbi:MAG: hypothetical protein LH654_09740 [Thermoleophilia bacterium]|nr:hypothetical protein [Thermoleophilia bacterium]